jgi:tryptophanyl-tRNA synthetase
MTDSLPFVTFDPVNRPGISNLLSIYSACTGESVESAAERFRDFAMKDFKSAVAEGVEGNIGVIRKEMERFARGGQEGFLREVSEKGVARARERARVVLEEVKEKVGLGPM